MSFNRVYDVFVDNEILSLRKYTTKGVQIFEFELDDWDKIKEKNFIKNCYPVLYILEKSTKELYIGQTENFLNRIENHKKSDKEFDKLYIIGSEYFNKNILLELESETIKIFKNSVSNYKVINTNINNNSFLNESDLIKFSEHLKVQKEIYFLLKLNILPKKITEENQEMVEKFYYKDGKLIIVDGGFMLLKGSKIFEKYLNDDIKKENLRINLKVLSNLKTDKNGYLLENLFSKYPSPLSALLSGYSTNGYESFITKSKISLNKYLNRKNISDN